MRNSVPRAVVHLLRAPGSSSRQELWHGARRRVSAAGQHVAVVDFRVFVAVPVGAAAGSDAIWPGDAADLGLSAAAAVDPQARLVARDGPELHPPPADG